MNTRLFASIVGLALVAGCSTPGYKAAEKTNNSLADVKTELVTDKTALRTAVDNLNDLVYNPQSDLRPQYEKFSKSVNVLDKSAISSRKSAKEFAANREGYLAKWRADTSAITDVDLRARAIDRIHDTEKDFVVLGDKLIAADNALTPLVADIKAIRDYLGNDLTAANIRLVSDRATTAKNNSIAVNQKIDDAIVETDKVSNAIAPMPATAPSDTSTTAPSNGM
jgi:hypothetical protein